MGSCLSCGSDDDSYGRGRVPNRQTVYSYSNSPPTRLVPAPTPATRTSLSSYNTYRYSYTIDNGASRATQEVPSAYVIRKPTPTVPAVRTTYVNLCPSKPVPKPIEFKPKPGALYGEYKCGSCKYYWDSRLSWRDKYQQCKRCKTNVRPRFQRELLPSDFTSRDGADESKVHPKELCEMCKQMGGYCGRYK